jgi:hypothetical protein
MVPKYWQMRGSNPKALNLSLIMFDEDRESYCCEKRVESMMEELHIEDSNKISISSKNLIWNIKMIVATAISCIVSITPYIHLNLHDPNTLSHFVRWAFPVIRAIGGFLTATMIQLVIQNRLLAIMRKHLIFKGLKEDELRDLCNDPKLTLHQPCSVLEQVVRLTIKSLASRTASYANDTDDLEKGKRVRVDGRSEEPSETDS